MNAAQRSRREANRASREFERAECAANAARERAFAIARAAYIAATGDTHEVTVFVYWQNDPAQGTPWFRAYVAYDEATAAANATYHAAVTTAEKKRSHIVGAAWRTILESDEVISK